ncbi:MAG: chemotaxis protein CheW, partial [Methylovulum sp.]|nr:chemotaxis protein CheW [Methylovulum sp.]
MPEPLPLTGLDTRQPYFVFALNGYFYAVPAPIVQEIVYLPELTLLATGSPDMVGVFDLRGHLMPVLDVRLRFQQPTPPYQASDGIIILNVESQSFGLIVNEVYDVCTADSVHDNPLLYSANINSELALPLLLGSLKKADRVITLLNAAALLQQADFTRPETGGETGDFYGHALHDDRALFALWAEKLKWQDTREDAGIYLALAVVILNDEYFGIDLAGVREFAHIANIVPIPCTPSHILGCINLRGNVITLIDMRQAIHLPPKPVQADSKAVVINTADDVAVAILVDGVKEVIYVDPQKITPVPTAVASASGDYLTGEMLYQDKLLTLIDLDLILEKGELVVEEEV